MMTGLIDKIIGKLIYRHQLPCYMLCYEPLVVVSYWQDFVDRHDASLKVAGGNGQPVYFLFQLGWHRENKERALELKNILNDIISQCQLGAEYHFIFLANSEKEEELIQACGLTCHYIHQNAFLDEQNYSVIPGVNKRYDAIYLARITPFKRHHLASKIKQLKLIGAYHDYEKEYAEKVLREVHYTSWVKKVFSHRVAHHLNQARVGLCLSQEEGAMFVSAEYLLCGLPVVTTVSIGGRDGLFDNDYVMTVADDPDAVAEGVQKMIQKELDPLDIRSRTIEKMQYHRQQMMALIQQIYDCNNINKRFADEWSEVFIHKLGLRSSVPLAIQRSRMLRLE